MRGRIIVKNRIHSPRHVIVLNSLRIKQREFRYQWVTSNQSKLSTFHRYSSLSYIFLILEKKEKEEKCVCTKSYFTKKSFSETKTWRDLVLSSRESPKGWPYDRIPRATTTFFSGSDIYIDGAELSTCGRWRWIHILRWRARYTSTPDLKMPLPVGSTDPLRDYPIELLFAIVINEQRCWSRWCGLFSRV